MAGSAKNGRDPLGVGWYVIEGFHDDPARVVAGPTDHETARSRALFSLDPMARVMHTPALVYAIEVDDYNVEWGEEAEVPEPLVAERDP